jgi:hypothetical protein
LAVGLSAGFASALGRHRHSPLALRRWGLVAVAMAFVALLFAPALLPIAGSAFDEASDPATARVALYRTSVQIATDRFPLGVGAGRFGSPLSKDPYSPVYFEYGLDRIRGLTPEAPRFAQDAFWARVLGESGVFGLAALLIFTAALGLALWRSAHVPYGEPLADAFTLGAWMVFVHTLVDSLAGTGFDAPTRMYLLLGAVGVALSLARRHERRGSTDPWVRDPRRDPEVAA